PKLKAAGKKRAFQPGPRRAYANGPVSRRVTCRPGRSSCTSVGELAEPSRSAPSGGSLQAGIRPGTWVLHVDATVRLTDEATGVGELAEACTFRSCAMRLDGEHLAAAGIRRQVGAERITGGVEHDTTRYGVLDEPGERE